MTEYLPRTLEAQEFISKPVEQGVVAASVTRDGYASPYMIHAAGSASHGILGAHSSRANYAVDSPRTEFRQAGQSSQQMPSGNAPYPEVFRAPTARNRTPRSSGSPDSGSWSHSKRWLSQEARDRNAFSKTMTNLRHIGADKSPFIPDTPSKMAAFKAEFAEDRRKELLAELNQRQETADRRKRMNLTKGELALAETKVEPLFGGRQFETAHSPVLALPNCFNAHQPRADHMRVDWPTLAEFKEEGERRAGRYGRCLPLPRLNMVDPRFAMANPEDVLNSDGSIRWQAKLPIPEPHYILPISPPDEW
ncbi:Mitotic-spindle organizing protein 1 [Purpureocillium lavendulum]|uniref:Mitotic-spindle organizing protein 1 n=1 Tax=Purpureocillium lavendulum TaxID=1247861 RepID=A0AB34FK86_9HYPO|nr:Mitotic-spindle organizing protein 1 [Purpureocillium lavendulum]